MNTQKKDLADDLLRMMIEMRDMEKWNNIVYPYVVVRLMPTVYSRRRVAFVPKGSEECWSDPQNRGRFDVCCERPFKNGDLTPEAKEALIMVLHQAIAASNLRVCAVFGPIDAVYVEPGGQTVPSNRPPYGGIWVTSSGLIDEEVPSDWFCPDCAGAPDLICVER